MRAGRLRDTIEVQRNAQSKENHELVDNWHTLVFLRAQKLEPKGDEITNALRSESTFSTVFRARYRTGITPLNRVVFEGRTFDIRSVTNPDGRKRMMDLHCTEDLSDGD